MKRRHTMIEELERDIREHIERETQDNIDRGLTPDEARFAAIRKFGNATRVTEDTREVWKMVGLEQFFQDLKFGARMLRKTPGFTVVAVLTLALGIGANTVIFSVINGLLLQPLPFHQADRIVTLNETEVSPGSFPLTGADYLDWQAQNSTFQASSLFDSSESMNASGGGDAEPASGASVQANFFDVLGISPMLGRGFEPGSDAAGKNHEVVLSYAFWQRRFGGRHDAVGKTLELNNETYAVIGVMPPRFDYPAGTDMWTPLDMSPKALTPRGTHSYPAIGRLKNGVTPKQAQADLAAIAARIEKQFPGTNGHVGAVVTPLKDVLIGDSSASLWILLGAVALVLLVACANVANLLLARAGSRAREIAMRAALGAGRRRIIQQALTESVLLAFAGAALGWIGAYWMVAFARNEFSGRLPQAAAIRLDLAVLAFTAIVSVAVGVIFGLAPAFFAARVNLNDELKMSAGVSNATRGRRGLRDFLVAGEIAVSLALLLGAGLLLRSFANLRSIPMGFDSSNVLTAMISLPEHAYKDLGSRRAFFDRLLDRIKALAGVETASISSAIPLRGGSNGTVTTDGTMSPELASQLVETNSITPDFFSAYRIPLIRGRSFTTEDVNQTAVMNLRADALTPEQAQHPPADLQFIGVANETMARMFWPKQDAVGKVIHMGGIPMTVIGVVGDVKEWSDLRHKPLPEIYFPATLVLDNAQPMYLTVKAQIPPAPMEHAIRGEIAKLDGGLALFKVRTMDAVIADSMRDTTMQTALLGSFAMLALVLAAIGIYGVMSYAVSQREHEFGIRMALGAPRSSVSRLVVSKGLRLAMAGVAVGLVLAVALARLMSSLVFGVSVWDPVTFAAAAIVLMIVAMLACYIPAQRATRVDPLVALRHE
ncbi:MAG: ABC transporter permease [Candidatus Acidiferrales bacterium]